MGGLARAPEHAAGCVRESKPQRGVTVLLACLLQTLEEVTPKATPAKGAKAKGGKKK